MEGLHKRAEGPKPVIQEYLGLKELFPDKNSPDFGEETRAIKYLRTLGQADVGVLDKALNLRGETFSFFKGLKAPGAIVEPLFDKLVQAPRDEKDGAAEALLERLALWDANEGSGRTIN